MLVAISCLYVAGEDLLYLADTLGMDSAIVAVAGITAISGIVTGLVMRETLRSTSDP